MAMTTKKQAVRVITDDYLDLIRRFPLAPIRRRRQINAAHAMIDELTRIPESRLTVGHADYGRSRRPEP